MSFDWADFLTLADALMRDPNSPGPKGASLRSAISRAYYAAFCSARNFAHDRENFVPQGTADDHWRLKNHFRRSHRRTRRKIATNLDRLRDNRNKADYDDLVSGLDHLTQSSVAVARNVLNALNSL